MRGQSKSIGLGVDKVHARHRRQPARFMSSSLRGQCPNSGGQGSELRAANPRRPGVRVALRGSSEKKKKKYANDQPRRPWVRVGLREFSSRVMRGVMSCKIHELRTAASGVKVFRASLCGFGGGRKGKKRRERRKQSHNSAGACPQAVR